MNTKEQMAKEIIAARCIADESGWTGEEVDDYMGRMESWANRDTNELRRQLLLLAGALHVQGFPVAARATALAGEALYREMAVADPKEAQLMS